MKTVLSILMLLMLGITSFAQQSIDAIMALKPDKIDYYDDSEIIYKIEMPYAKSSVQKQNLPTVEDLDRLISIDLVYTEFRRSERFSQPKLNKYRLQTLKKAIPEIFELEHITWNIIEQTGPTTMEEAKRLYHGFVFNISEERGSEEIEYIETIVNEENEEEIDSTVLTVFERNNWSEMLITADLTGSMSPYVAQVLLWFKLNNIDQRAKYFMFFNDGNSTPDEHKKVGKTGGLYQSPASDYETIEALAYQTIRAGDGGDWQENDVEALYFGIQNCPKCKDVILIADNDSPVRDWRMMKMIKRPVRVILCGVEDNYLNPQYLNLARITKGSIHTIEKDITDLMKINEGESIEVNGITYKIYKGNFVIKRED
ncbi:MAG: hypothetical protein AB8G11_18300 [Saprospiraceae bacterium]